MRTIALQMRIRASSFNRGGTPVCSFLEYRITMETLWDKPVLDFAGC
ncbi:hypothetical protein LJR255_005345 [Pararhizobium sp. LjRoot255]